MSQGTAKIKSILQKLYQKYNHKKFIPPDPLQFAYRYSSPADIEIAAFLSASLAYGRVQQIEKSLNSLFGLMKNGPFEYVSSFNSQKRRSLSGFKHRFTSGENISDLLALFRQVLARHGSIENFFLTGYSTSDSDIIPALTSFCDSLADIYSKQHNKPMSRGLKYLLVNPAGGSTCKRLNLFLRWMVRSDSVDTGLWKSIDKNKLIVPVDVHIARLTRILGFHDQKAVSLSTAVKITRAFAEIEPDDPVKYDFALSRIGILENCTGRIGRDCVDCQLYSFCAQIKENQHDGK